MHCTTDCLQVHLLACPLACVHICLHAGLFVTPAKLHNSSLSSRTHNLYTIHHKQLINLPGVHCAVVLLTHEMKSSMPADEQNTESIRAGQMGMMHTAATLMMKTVQFNDDVAADIDVKVISSLLSLESPSSLPHGNKGSVNFGLQSCTCSNMVSCWIGAARILLCASLYHV